MCSKDYQVIPFKNGDPWSLTVFELTNRSSPRCKSVHFTRQQFIAQSESEISIF